MKKTFLLLASALLLCGGTVVNTKTRDIPAGPSAISKLESIAISMDSTAYRLDQSSHKLKNLKK